MNTALQDLASAMKYVIDNMNPDATVEHLTYLCNSYKTTSVICELFRFDKNMKIGVNNTLLHTVIKTEEFQSLLKRYVSGYFTLVPDDYEADISKDDIFVSAQFSLPTHYHNTEPCWERATDCIPCPACGGRMEPGEYSGRGCSRTCAYSR